MSFHSCYPAYARKISKISKYLKIDNGLKKLTEVINTQRTSSRKQPIRMQLSDGINLSLCLYFKSPKGVKS